MREKVTLKEIILSGVAVVLAGALLWVIDLGLNYFFDYVIFDVFNWFNGLQFIFKIGILILGGVTVFILALNVISTVSAYIGGLIFDRLPDNQFTQIVLGILALGNAGWYIVKLWRAINHFSFWVICELLIMSVFIWALCIIVVPLKGQKRENTQEY